MSSPGRMGRVAEFPLAPGASSHHVYGVEFWFGFVHQCHPGSAIRVPGFLPIASLIPGFSFEAR